MEFNMLTNLSSDAAFLVILCAIIMAGCIGLIIGLRWRTGSVHNRKEKQ